jgi:hypothetical protein
MDRMAAKSGIRAKAVPVVVIAVEPPSAASTRNQQQQLQRVPWQEDASNGIEAARGAAGTAVAGGMRAGLEGGVGSSEGREGQGMTSLGQEKLRQLDWDVEMGRVGDALQDLEELEYRGELAIPPSDVEDAGGDTEKGWEDGGAMEVGLRCQNELVRAVGHSGVQQWITRCWRRCC